jgi:hypothetical protein
LRWWRVEGKPKARARFVHLLLKRLEEGEPGLKRLVEEGLRREDAAILYAVANAHIAYIRSLGDLDRAVEVLKLVLREEGYEV